MSSQQTPPTRRSLLAGSAAGVAAALAPKGALALSLNLNLVAAATPGAPPAATPFQRSTVLEAARQLAKSAFAPPPTDLPDAFKNLSYDQYRDIRFRDGAAIWANTDLPFQVQFFHRGFYFKDVVEISIVESGMAHHLAYSPDMFNFGPLVPRPLPTTDIGFAGFRIHGHINRPDYYDELVVFQGASYFRSLGKGQAYGLSSRGLAIKTAEPEGEEFPLFRKFWIERPDKSSDSIVVHALLDSQSVTGAYRFSIRPGLPTTMDVEVTLFPRVDLKKFGIAPGTSMFYFGPNQRQNFDDYRPEVHDSDGLLMLNGRGERLWRPLANPRDLQISAFVDTAPRGFGLMQRDRDFDTYEDIEAAYERRPSLWVEPVGDWGPGVVMLVEIPSSSEINDNMVAFWQPRDVLPAGSEYSFSYRLFWGNDPVPQRNTALVQATRIGRGSIKEQTALRLFVLDFAMSDKNAPKPATPPKAQVSASVGKVSEVTVSDNAFNGGWRVSFKLDPADAPLIELRAELTFADGTPAEIWVYRWTG
jgi:glucans biosynthesis protein